MLSSLNLLARSSWWAALWAVHGTRRRRCRETRSGVPVPFCRLLIKTEWWKTIFSQFLEFIRFQWTWVQRPFKSIDAVILALCTFLRKSMFHPKTCWDVGFSIFQWLSPRSASGRRPCKYYPVPCFYWSRALFGSAREARIFGTGLRDGTEIGLN